MDGAGGAAAGAKGGTAAGAASEFARVRHLSNATAIACARQVHRWPAATSAAGGAKATQPHSTASAAGVSCPLEALVASAHASVPTIAGDGTAARVERCSAASSARARSVPATSPRGRGAREPLARPFVADAVHLLDTSGRSAVSILFASDYCRMPGAKAKAKAKPKAKAVAEGVPPADVVTALAAPSVRWITLSVRLVTWGYLNFTMRVPITTRVFEVRERIVSRHGGSISAGEVRIYKEDVSQRNVITDLMLTLEELDIGAAAPGADAAGEEGGESVLFYDFRPVATDCPLLLSEPPNYRFAAEMRRVAELEEEKRAKEEARQQKRTVSEKVLGAR
ncbi:hypothetical protein KFE25_002312 [Diacronema lutheri]|uniref:Uncharacterized protein n=2 Tax=Diacronema lutheri TaxID=2081491 RepID=A0A8J5X759_DIALT|nr:hypothetical protein KFE25_002312 [Diacronema lutheri]